MAMLYLPWTNFDLTFCILLKAVAENQISLQV